MYQMTENLLVLDTHISLQPELEAAQAAKELTEAFRASIRTLLDGIKPTVTQLQQLSLDALRTEKKQEKALILTGQRCLIR